MYTVCEWGDHSGVAAKTVVSGYKIDSKTGALKKWTVVASPKGERLPRFSSSQWSLPLVRTLPDGSAYIVSFRSARAFR